MNTLNDSELKARTKRFGLRVMKLVGCFAQYDAGASVRKPTCAQRHVGRRRRYSRQPARRHRSPDNSPLTEQMNEATARIRINRLLEEAGWRFFPEGDKPAPAS